jgi:AcrR family transcriptional regulator
MPRTTQSTPTKERVLDAAENLVLDHGATALTLERAATEAGLSKGGILYHFPSRNALISAMVQRLADQLDADLERRVTGTGPGALTRAYIAECFDPDPDDSRRRADRLGAALLATTSNQDDLLAPLRDQISAWQRALADDGLDPVLAVVIRLASDGLWLSEIFGLLDLDPGLRERVRATLERFTETANP